jgi:hypothetical protein
MLARQIIIKAPTESFLDNWDFTHDLSAGETMTNGSVVVSPAGLSASVTGTSGSIVQVSLSGGTQDIDYTVTLTGTTSLSHTLLMTAVVQVRIARTP